MDTIDPAKVVSKEEFLEKKAALFNNAQRIQVETPAEEAKILADLLGVTPETLGETGAGFAKGKEACGKCGRSFTFLDIAETGLKVHTKEFLVDVITGKHGYIANSGNQHFNCHNCGTQSDLANGYYDYYTNYYYYYCYY